jgi:hypothetical protein
MASVIESEEHGTSVIESAATHTERLCIFH